MLLILLASCLLRPADAASGALCDTATAMDPVALAREIKEVLDRQHGTGRASSTITHVNYATVIVCSW